MPNYRSLKKSIKNKKNKKNKKSKRSLKGGKPPRRKNRGNRQQQQESRNQARRQNNRGDRGKQGQQGDGNKGQQGDGNKGHLQGKDKQIDDLKKQIAKLKDGGKDGKEGKNKNSKDAFKDKYTTGPTVKRYLKNIHRNVATLYGRVRENCSKYPFSIYDSVTKFNSQLETINGNIHKAHMGECREEYKRKRYYNSSSNNTF